MFTFDHMSFRTALTSPESNEGRSDMAEFSSFANLSELKLSSVEMFNVQFFLCCAVF